MIKIATSEDIVYAQTLCDWYKESAKARGIGIAKRERKYIEKKMIDGDAVIAFNKLDNRLLGFCYIETFDDKNFVVNSGLIIHPNARNLGLGKKIKMKIFQLSRKKYPQAKIFGITTSLAVMRINTQIGYHPVTFSELTSSEDFWKGCKSCKNYSILQENNKKVCLCTAMVYDKFNDEN